MKLLARYYFEKKSIALICAGPTLLKAAGIAESYKLTAYPCFEADLKEAYHFTLDEEVITDRNVITRCVLFF